MVLLWFGEGSDFCDPNSYSCSWLNDFEFFMHNNSLSHCDISSSFLFSDFEFEGLAVCKYLPSQRCMNLNNKEREKKSITYYGPPSYTALFVLQECDSHQSKADFCNDLYRC